MGRELTDLELEEVAAGKARTTIKRDAGDAGASATPATDKPAATGCPGGVCKPRSA